VPAYLEAVGLELNRVASLGRAAPLQTVYFGGGTPSMLEVEQVRAVLRLIDRLFGIEEGAEITFEAHPATVGEVKLRELRAAGVSRISFGGESLDDAVLTGVGRTHNAADVLESIASARKAAFESVALDLMYGLPIQTHESWRATLENAISSGVDHLSLYPLSVEPDTVFDQRRRHGGLDVPADDTVVAMYCAACEVLNGAGFEHYEVANWARPGSRCRHNLAYWHNLEFFGVGVGAHGYIRPLRTENLRRARHYIDCLRAGGSPVAQAELVDETSRLNEAIMLGFRLLSDGLDLESTRQAYGCDVLSEFQDELAELQDADLVRVRGNRLILNEWAVPVANEIWSRFVRVQTPTNVM
jgi:oxygen-independent coproporphyrinogen III oxidase